MSVRSHYTENSYRNMRATMGNRAKWKSKACENCIYRLQVETMTSGGAVMPEIPNAENLTPRQLVREQRRRQPVNQQVPVQVTQLPGETTEKKSLLKRFGDYVAKNQADMKAAGETSLMEDLSDMGKKMFNNAGQLGQEEIDRINKKSADAKQNDEEIMDFMVGKRKNRK